MLLLGVGPTIFAFSSEHAAMAPSSTRAAAPRTNNLFDIGLSPWRWLEGGFDADGEDVRIEGVHAGVQLCGGLVAAEPLVDAAAAPGRLHAHVSRVDHPVSEHREGGAEGVVGAVLVGKERRDRLVRRRGGDAGKPSANVDVVLEA